MNWKLILTIGTIGSVISLLIIQDAIELWARIVFVALVYFVTVLGYMVVKGIRWYCFDKKCERREKR